jgi:hypothetical protein
MNVPSIATNTRLAFSCVAMDDFMVSLSCQFSFVPHVRGTPIVSTRVVSTRV